MNMLVAKVAVSAATYHIDKPYDYIVSPEDTPLVAPGMRVSVPFGRGNKECDGVILALSHSKDKKKLKQIIRLIDETPIFTDENIKLALWMSDRFFSTVYDCLKVMLPTKTNFKHKNKKSDEVRHDTADTHFELTKEQSDAFLRLSSILKEDSPQAALLFGVTGSGKTLIYISLIDIVLSIGKTAIVLVPEIALTPQTVSIFQSHFGNTVAVLHSALGDRERFLQWKNICDGQISVVVGTRSAVFAPLKNIGLIVIDEEQESTYKSESSPRYHAREVAKYRVTRDKAMLLLSSATPAIESMYAAKLGKYHLIQLARRYNEKQLPHVMIVDMKKEVISGNNSSISDLLRSEISENLSRGEQTILFVNRRGTSPQVVCKQCAFTFICNFCSVSMTYHATGAKFLCHYCGGAKPETKLCPQCAYKLSFIGAGTQKIQSELCDMFPGVKIIRMDADTTSRKESHNKLLSSFRRNEAQILLGTQMVTKGLDFENVTLVGVLSADLLLYMSDFRSGERTFSLITQVVGRSGRGEKEGRAIIQTYSPQNEVIMLASNQDYDRYYESEIAIRTALAYPPVTDIIALTVLSGDEEKAYAASCVLKKSVSSYLCEFDNIKILGPAPPVVSKVSNKYRYRILVICQSSKRLREVIAHVVRQFSGSKAGSGLTVYADAVYYDY